MRPWVLVRVCSFSRTSVNAIPSVYKPQTPSPSSEYVRNYDKLSFAEQARHFHSADLVLSPHGAQLTNAVYARPCTVVLELMPQGFYHPKKLPLLMEAGGVGFYGYRYDGSPIAETRADSMTGKSMTGNWGPVRDVPTINASVDSILFAMPDLLHAGITCRRQWALKHMLKHNF